MAKINYTEYGSEGLQSYQGFIEEAYHTDLTFPTVVPLYNRLRRSDPEITLVRQLFVSLARGLEIYFEPPEQNPKGSAENKASDFGNEVLQDIEGGVDSILENVLSYVPFMGWGYWEVLPGLRVESWIPPGDDEWKSKFKDGKIGIRRLAFRDPSSFSRWNLSDKGRLKGMYQRVDNLSNEEIMIPLDASLHLSFGDANNPEGLSPLEAVWRLERIKYGLEIIQGLGFEHSAGYLSVAAQKKPDDEDKAMIKQAARNIMTAQEGNYAVWPPGVEGELKDVGFQAAGSLLEAIRYFGILKLLVFNMQWVTMSSLSDTGSYGAVQDSSSFFFTFYNAMLEGFVDQMDRQIGKRIFEWNQFPGMQYRPKLKITRMEKTLDLVQLGQFMQTALQLAQSEFMRFGERDIIAIRKRSGFLSESPPADDEVIEVKKPAPPPNPFGRDPEEDMDPEEGDDNNTRSADMAKRPFAVSSEEHPIDSTSEAIITQEDIDKAVREFDKWARKYSPDLAGLLNAEVE